MLKLHLIHEIPSMMINLSLILAESRKETSAAVRVKNTDACSEMFTCSKHGNTDELKIMSMWWCADNII